MTKQEIEDMDVDAIIANIHYHIDIRDWIYIIKDDEGQVWFSSESWDETVKEYEDKYVSEEEIMAMKIEADAYNSYQAEQAANRMLSYVHEVN